MYYAFAATLDLTTKGKRLCSVHCAASAAAVVNLRDGGVAGPIVVQLQIPISTSKEIAYALPGGLVFSAGCYVQVVSGTVVGSVDLL